MMDEGYIELVLSTVEQIPPGQVASYGDIAELVGVGGPRLVGRVMSLQGSGVPWWRVVAGRAGGHAGSSCPPVNRSGRRTVPAGVAPQPRAEMWTRAGRCSQSSGSCEKLGMLLQVVCVVVRATPPGLLRGRRATPGVRQQSRP